MAAKKKEATVGTTVVQSRAHAVLQLGVPDQHSFLAMVTSMRDTFWRNFHMHATTVYETDFTNNDRLWELYLKNIPAKDRQYHTCNCCKSFFRKYAGLVIVTADKAPTTMFDAAAAYYLYPAVNYYKRAFRAIGNAMAKAKLVRPFLPKEEDMGVKRTDDGAVWYHFHSFVPPPYLTRSKEILKHHSTVDDPQSVGNIVMELGNSLLAFLTNHMPDQYIIERWKNLIHSVPRSEKFSAEASDFNEVLQELRISGLSAFAGKLLWMKPNVLHFPSSIIATMLGMMAGETDRTLLMQFKERVDPLKYQRPKAPPAAGNVVSGERIIAKLHLQNALPRIMAPLSTAALVRKRIWGPSRIPLHRKKDTRQLKEASVATLGSNPGGVFADVHTKTNSAVQRSGSHSRVTVAGVLARLHDIARIKVETAPTMSFFCLTGPKNGMTVGAMLKWDDDSRPTAQRNPFGWYTYPTGNAPAAWGLRGQSHVPVMTILPMPNCWESKANTYGFPEQYLLVLAGCCDQNTPGNGLFPELLRPELRECKTTIEQYNKQNKIGRPKNSSTQMAAGVLLKSGLKLHVTWKSGANVVLTIAG